ncbi:MAG: hypothetical protein DWQ07_12715 [Chloroflexi bacterium]|nr:MAG: hypothetical protein DWQ07_12715 [Chloroflexota bacterium]MBL1196901.1 hypothetical protein [Chloroflexota bacterium]NOH14197.1 hypothetical protein [Chloroflexota bacterium]
MAEKTEKKQTKKQETRIGDLALILEVDVSELNEKLALAVTQREIDLDTALDEAEAAVKSGAMIWPWDVLEDDKEEGEEGEDTDEADVTMLLGLISQQQTAHEELKADFEHLLEWAHRRGYRKE